MGGWGQPKDLTKKKLTIENPDYVAPVIGEEGGQEFVKVMDDSAIQVMSDLLIQIQKLNMYLSLITDTYIKDGDIA